MVPESMRRDWLARFARSVLARESEFASLIGEELDRSAWEVFTEEIEPLLAACRWHRGRGLALLRPRRLRGRAWWQFGQRHWSMRVPRGRVAIIATWNYPVQLLGIQLVQSIAAGNQVVVKPSELAARSQHLLLQCAQEAAERSGMPAGWIEAVEPTRAAGERLLAEQSFDFVIFTGSTGVGRAVARQCAETLTPSALELSGRDSAIVLDDADTQLAARSIWHGLSMNGGQTCMAPRRVLVTRHAYRAFAASLGPLAAAAKSRRMISEAAAATCFELARDAIDRGGRSASGMLEAPTGPDRRVWRPHAILDCPASAPLVEGRHFGPVMAVVPVEDEVEAIAIHARCDQRLATSVYTARASRWRDPERIAELGSALVTINDTIIPTGHPAASIAGTGESGWSATRGVSGLQALTREVILSATDRRIRVPIEPPAASGQRILRKVAQWLSGTNRGESA